MKSNMIKSNSYGKVISSNITNVKKNSNDKLSDRLVNIPKSNKSSLLKYMLSGKNSTISTISLKNTVSLKKYKGQIPKEKEISLNSKEINQNTMENDNMNDKVMPQEPTLSEEITMLIKSKNKLEDEILNLRNELNNYKKVDFNRKIEDLNREKIILKKEVNAMLNICSEKAQELIMIRNKVDLKAYHEK